MLRHYRSFCRTSILTTENQTSHKEGSIIVILATSAPLHPLQLQRLAKRATVGVVRVGGWGGNGSGDTFLAFSTGTNPQTIAW